MTDGKIKQFSTIYCFKCDISFGVTERFHTHLRKSGQSFYCPNGHSQAYCDSEADELRRERDRLKQRLAQKDDEIKRAHDKSDYEQRRASAYMGQITKIKNRVGAGVCPCCNRSFQNLRRHMSSKHPDYRKSEPDLEVIKGGAA